MKKSKFTDSQILGILKQAESGTPAPQLCREHGISSATFYKWRARSGGMDASLMARLKELEDEQPHIKHRRNLITNLGKCLLYDQKGTERNYSFHVWNT